MSLLKKDLLTTAILALIVLAVMLFLQFTQKPETKFIYQFF